MYLLYFTKKTNFIYCHMQEIFASKDMLVEGYFMKL